MRIQPIVFASVVMALASMGCASKSALVTHDASTPDVASDVAPLVDLALDDAAGVADVRPEPDAWVPAPDGVQGAPDAHSGADTWIAMGGDARVDAVPSADAGTGGAGPDGASAGDGGEDGARASDSPPNTGYADACAAVANATFLSTEDHECGLGPTGVSMCRWRLSFTDKSGTRSVSWRLSDYSLTMSYTCEGFTLRGTLSGRQDFVGTYDPVTNILHWDQFDYERSAP